MVANDDDFLNLVGDSLTGLFDTGADQDAPAEITPDDLVIEEPAEASRAVEGMLLYVGADDKTRTAFASNFQEAMPFYDTLDLREVRGLIDRGDVALIVFDPSSFIKPGIPITRFVKEKGLSIRVCHVYSENRVTEDYEKFRHYHVHLQPDYRASSDEIYALINEIRSDLGIT